MANGTLKGRLAPLLMLLMADDDASRGMQEAIANGSLAVTLSKDGTDVVLLPTSKGMEEAQQILKRWTGEDADA